MRRLNAYFFRHGESEANAGRPTDDPASIPLTEIGVRQAHTIADTFDATPERIVSSPFMRALQTAAPTGARFPHLTIEEWQIHELTYLSPPRCAGTSVAQRRPWVQAYWNAADPHYRDGDGAESFTAFIARVDAAITRLEQLHATEVGTVVLFGHGQFWQALRWRLRGRNARAPIDTAAMRAFQRRDTTTPIENGKGFQACFDGHVWRVVDDNPYQE